MIKGSARSLIGPRLWAWLRLIRIRFTLWSYPSREVAHTYGGFPLRLVISDPLAEGWYDHDWPEQPEVAFLSRHGLMTGARVFDVGAHQAVVALMLARLVGPKGQVVAIEANPHNARAAERNRVMNGADNLRVLEAAVGAECGPVIFNRGLNGQMDDGEGLWGRRRVSAVTVDALAERFGPPDVLFIDVEGYECQVLEGAMTVLRRRPDCFVEVHVGQGLEKLGGSVESLASFFPESGFDRFSASPDAQFAPFRLDSPCVRDRFYFIALGKRGDASKKSASVAAA